MNTTAENIHIPSAQEYLPAVVTDMDERQQLQAMIGPAMELALHAHEFQVTDTASYQSAADYRKQCRHAKDRADAFRRSFTDPLNTVVKRWNAFFKPPMDTLMTGADIYEGKLLAYDREQRRLADEAKRKAEEEAAAEQRRLQREAERVAKSLEKKGAPEAAAEVRASVPDVPAVPAYVAPARPQGTTILKVYRGDCYDLGLLLAAIVEGKAPISLVVADQSALNKYAAATKCALTIPGVKFRIEETVRQR